MEVSSVEWKFGICRFAMDGPYGLPYTANPIPTHPYIPFHLEEIIFPLVLHTVIHGIIIQCIVAHQLGKFKR